MIDNVSEIRRLLTFSNPDEFYFIQIMQRKKDFPAHTQNVDAKILRSYYIYSLEEFDAKYTEIIGMCNLYHARAYIWLNRRNCREICLYAIQELARYASEVNCQRSYRVYDHCIGKLPTKCEKLWVVDFDSKSEDTLRTLCNLINRCDSKYDPVVVEVTFTKSGYHIITHPFNIVQLTSNSHIPIKAEDIKKDSPTLLYYGGSN